MDRFLGVLGFEEEELGDDGGGHGFVYFTVEADDAFLRKGLRCAHIGSFVVLLSYLQ